MGDLTGAKKAAKIQAKATTDAANAQAQADRYAAQAATQSVQTSIAQDKAARMAAEQLAVPAETVDVALGASADPGVTLDASGKRRTRRSQFVTPAASGINI